MWKWVVIGVGSVLLTGGMLHADEKKELEMQMMLLQEMAKTRMAELRVINEIELPRVAKLLEELEKKTKKEEKK